MVGTVAAEIVSERPSELVGFYERILLTPFRREAYGYPHPCWVSLGTDRLSVILQDARNLEPGSSWKPGTGRFLLYVPDLPTLEERLRRADVTVVERRNVGLAVTPVRPRTWGRFLVTVRDPDGNRVSIRERTDRPRTIAQRLSDRGSDLGYVLREGLRRAIFDAAAYRLDRIRVRSRDLSGFTHVAASREGIFALREDGFCRLAAGAFYGLTVREGEIVALQSHAAADSNAPRGRLVRLEHDGERILRAEVLRRGLPAGSHQIDFIGGKLHVVDTHAQRVLRLDGEFRDEADFFPVGPAESWDWSGGYVHLNSITSRDGEILLLLHNGLVSGRLSEIVQTDREFRVRERFEVPAGGAHDIVCLEDGGIWVCDSRGGNVVDREGPVLHVGPGMTRGLSVDARNVVVGESLFATRVRRRRVPGHVHFFDRELRRRATLTLPAAPTTIRRIDGDDLSLARI